MNSTTIVPAEGITPVFSISEMSIHYRLTETPVMRNKVVSSGDAYHFIKPFYGMDLELRESFFIILLNQANHIIGVSKLSVGGMASCIVDNRLILLYAIQALAMQVIIVHNHPSGNLQPSQSDKELTGKVKEALKLVDIKLIDHLILSEYDYYSFADDGMM